MRLAILGAVIASYAAFIAGLVALTMPDSTLGIGLVMGGYVLMCLALLLEMSRPKVAVFSTAPGVRQRCMDCQGSGMESDEHAHCRECNGLGWRIPRA